jgi:hypothetical protein
MGLRRRQLNLFGPVRDQVHMAQKVVKHTPIQPWDDAFIALLAGAQGLVAINQRLRADPGLQAAFGRQACAEQSVVQETLDACTDTQVAQMHQALDAIYRQHSRGYRHDYPRSLQGLDAERTGMPCGEKAALATKGYVAKQRNRRGRQLGRGRAARDDEIVVDRLFGGTTQLTTALRPLVQAAEQTLALDADPRRRTLWRIDAGGGSVAEVNWLLDRGYQSHGKDYSGARAQTLAARVTTGLDDPRMPERQAGWVTVAATPDSRLVRRIAVRCRKKNGPWGVGRLISTLSPPAVLTLTRQPVDRLQEPIAVLLAYVYLDDQRGGGVETAIKGDTQGLGMTQRNKKRFAAQQMVTHLTAVAPNTMVWARHGLTPDAPTLKRWGILRMGRDVCQVSGKIVFDHRHRLSHIRLNAADPLAKRLVTSLRALLESEHIAVTLGQI